MSSLINIAELKINIYFSLWTLDCCCIFSPVRCSPLLLAIKPFLLDNHYLNRRPKGFCLFSTLDKIRFNHPPHLHMCTHVHVWSPVVFVFFPDADSAQMLMCFHTVLSTNMELLWWFKEGWVYFKPAALPACTMGLTHLRLHLSCTLTHICRTNITALVEF